MDESILKQYLEEVIIRIDFLKPADFVIESMPAELNSTIMASFPIAEPKELIAEELQISKDAVDRKKIAIKEWNFYGREREKRFCITRDCFFIVYTKYESFDVLKEEFLKVTELFFKLNNELQGKRLGLRYINKIKKAEANIFSWDDLLNKNLLSIFEIPVEEDKSKVARAFHNLEFNYGAFNLRFQYGMHNPDFPAPIRQKLFILDFDAYYQGLLSKNDNLEDRINKFHDAIKNLIKRC